MILPPSSYVNVLSLPLRLSPKFSILIVCVCFVQIFSTNFTVHEKYNLLVGAHISFDIKTDLWYRLLPEVLVITAQLLQVFTTLYFVIRCVLLPDHQCYFLIFLIINILLYLLILSCAKTKQNKTTNTADLRLMLLLLFFLTQ